MMPAVNEARALSAALRLDPSNPAGVAHAAALLLHLADLLERSQKMLSTLRPSDDALRNTAPSL